MFHPCIPGKKTMQRLSNNKWEDWKDEHLDLIDEEDKHMIFVAERDSFDWLRILILTLSIN